jgi:hypothetical protein
MISTLPIWTPGSTRSTNKWSMHKCLSMKVFFKKNEPIIDK